MRAIIFAITFAIAAVCFAADEKTTTLTGVVVQQDEDFVLSETENMKPIAALQGVEFATGNFANFIGQTVRVRGVLSTTKEGKKVLRVRTLADIQRVTL